MNWGFILETRIEMDRSITCSYLFPPDIDELARNGMKFTQFYSAYPICTPSRSGLLTGEVMFPYKEVACSVECTGEKP